MGTDMAVYSAPLEVRRTTLKERLEFQKKHAEEQLRNIERAIKILDENPDLQFLFDALSNSGISLY